MALHSPLIGGDAFAARPAVMGRRGVVASAHPLASDTGLDVLKRGGNAFDAAVAVNAVLNVTQPHMCGVGGDVFYLLFPAREGKVVFLNGSGRAARAAHGDYFRSRGLNAIPFRGPMAMITVPGCVDGWHEVLNRYGSMDWKDLLAPAIRYAEDGFPLSHQVAWWIAGHEDLNVFPSFAEIFFPSGRAPRAGDVLIQKDLARTLRTLAAHGRDGFYRGEIAEKMLQFSHSVGGFLGEEDLHGHHSDWGDPISTTYRGYRIYETPPNTQGLQAIQEFNLMEAFDVRSLGHNSAECLHLMCEAKKTACADRDRYITDPEFADIPLDELMSKDYADRRRSLLNPDRAMSSPAPAGDPRGDTTYFAIMDQWGNAVSCIQSIYFPFGCGMAVPGTGIIPQNRGAYFSLDPTHVNRLEPGKRTMHTLIASMVFDESDELFMVFGSMGGDGQPQTHLAVISNVLDFGMHMQQAIEAPRWLHGSVILGDPKSMFNLEGRISSSVIRKLFDLGHEVNVLDDWTWNMGHAQGILRDKNTGVLQGGADPRGDGYALAY